MSSKLNNMQECLIEDQWEEVKLVEVCDLISRGITPSYTEEGGIVVINQKCIRDNRVKLELARLTNPEKRKVPEQKLLRSYDVLINSTGVGTLGRVAQIKNVKESMTVDSHVTIVRANERVYPQYLGYNLFMQQRNIEHLAEGSTGQTELSRIRLGEAIKLLLPPFQTQKVIANILSSLDEKIETNNQINKKLEEMAQAIFKQWFVDFEFPNEDGNPYKSSGGKMLESEIGVIPEGWKIGCIGDYVKVKSGYAFKSAWWEESGIPVIKIKDIENNTLNIKDMSYVSPEKEVLAKDFLVEGGDLVIAMTGATIGKFGIVPKLENAMLVNQRVGKFFLGDKPFVKLGFIYCVLRQQKVYDEIVNRGSGSAQPNISPTGIETIKIILPSVQILEEFNSLVTGIFEKITENEYQNVKLGSLRDILLPKLMSGEIRVPIE
ncbi:MULTISPECIES: restriction endonuclease subunit S [unclassified Bacillus (in: firmicutes)]|uniref:restriction endonuclease subunit S n=1 Tax=unclassified Bacillus (in: firmicutes) TaxID=185979 RepID=UPI00300FF835